MNTRPSPLIIRQARKEDASAIARIHVESWRSTYAGLLPDKLLLRMNVAEHEARWWRHALARQRRSQFVYVADLEGEGIIGFGSGGASREMGLPYQGEIYTLYLADEFHGRGIGRRLFTALGERSLRERGPSVIVWVLAGNPNRFFYESLGGKAVARRAATLGGAPIEEIAYGWEDVRALVELGRSDRGG
jgi:GNAT superfamily N-acetyltransferase